MSVRDELRECGGVPLGDGFSQDSFRTHNVIEGANIANGYCAGVALDWIRRVLQPRNRLGVAHTGTTHLDYGRPLSMERCCLLSTPESEFPTYWRMESHGLYHISKTSANWSPGAGLPLIGGY